MRTDITDGYSYRSTTSSSKATSFITSCSSAYSSVRFWTARVECYQLVFDSSWFGVCSSSQRVQDVADCHNQGSDSFCDVALGSAIVPTHDVCRISRCSALSPKLGTIPNFLIRSVKWLCAALLWSCQHKFKFLYTTGSWTKKMVLLQFCNASLKWNFKKLSDFALLSNRNWAPYPTLPDCLQIQVSLHGPELKN